MADFSTKHVGYLMRSFLDDCDGVLDVAVPPGDLRIPDPSTVTLTEITGLSRFWDRESGKRKDPKQYQYRMQDVLTGCCGTTTPVVFALLGSPSSIRVLLGTADAMEPGASAEGRGDSLDMIRRSLPGHYPGIEQQALDGAGVTGVVGELQGLRHVGLLTGMPTNKTSEEEGDPTQLDRLIRTMFGTRWGLLVVAVPISQRQVTDHLNQVLNEMRAVENAEQPKMRRSPLAETYFKLLESQQKEFLTARATGLWTMSSYYLAADAHDLRRLGSALRACFGGADSSPDPVRTIEWPALAEVAPRFGRLQTEPAEGPGRIQMPHAYQTLLTSERLGTLIHLPRHEMPGYAVRENVRFGVAAHPTGEDSLRLGEILDRGQPIGADYRVSLPALGKHALIVGVTGSGKTNTTFHLLRQLWGKGIPFLVLEPAKTEYRALLDDETIGPDLQVFTAGDETISPFRINPFEVEPGVSVATHIDLIKATFNASFAMWSPLPQVLERCIHDVYRDAGWDIVHNTNRRLDGASQDCRGDAFPTITDLYETVDRVVDGLGYDDKITSDIKAALGTRLHSLRIGGKGVMLDARRSIPLSQILTRPTVIELEQIGDDDEKAFLMGLLLMKLYEHHRAGGTTEGTGLRHVVVIEEAHRLLANVPPASGEDSSNVKGKAVEAFVNMLSEVRAYGQGFMVAEQIPGKLALDVIKNTNLKVIHRTVAGDDREVLAKTTNMTQAQSEMLATLVPGRAAVFAEGDDRPIMTSVPYAKLAPRAEMATKAGSDGVVAQRMQSFSERPETAALFTPLEFCPESRGWSGDLTEFAGRIVESRAFQELFGGLALAALEAPHALGGSMARMRRFVEGHAPQFAINRTALTCVLAHGTRWYVSHFGRRLDWPYPLASEVAKALSDIGMRLIAGQAEGDREVVIDDDLLGRFRGACDAACAGRVDPLTGFGRVSPGREVLYRYHTELLLRDHHLTEIFDTGMGAAGVDGVWTDLSAVDQAVARLGGFALPPLVQDAIARSYAAQQIASKPGLLEIARELASEKLMAALDLQLAAALEADGEEGGPAPRETAGVEGTTGP